MQIMQLQICQQIMNVGSSGLIKIYLLFDTKIINNDTFVLVYISAQESDTVNDWINYIISRREEVLERCGSPGLNPIPLGQYPLVQQSSVESEPPPVIKPKRVQRLFIFGWMRIHLIHKYSRRDNYKFPHDHFILGHTTPVPMYLDNHQAHVH